MSDLSFSSEGELHIKGFCPLFSSDNVLFLLPRHISAELPSSLEVSLCCVCDFVALSCCYGGVDLSRMLLQVSEHVNSIKSDSSFRPSITSLDEDELPTSPRRVEALLWSDKRNLIWTNRNDSTLCLFSGHVGDCLLRFLPKVAAFVLRCTGETGPPLLRRRSQNGHGRGQDQRSGGSCQNHSVWGKNPFSLTHSLNVMQHWHLMSDLRHCPKELDPCQEPESLPVAQMKARRIIESFENPFRMVGVDSVRTCRVHVPASPSQTLSAFCFSSSIYPLPTCMSTRTPSLTRLPKYLRLCREARSKNSRQGAGLPPRALNFSAEIRRLLFTDQQKMETAERRAAAAGAGGQEETKSSSKRTGQESSR